MRKPKANNIRFGKRTSEFSPTASDLLKANQEQKQIGKIIREFDKISAIKQVNNQVASDRQRQRLDNHTTGR